MPSADTLTSSILAETRKLRQQMGAAYDVSLDSCTIGDRSAELETVRANLFTLMEQAKIRIHKASVNQTAPLTEQEAKLLNDSVYLVSAVLRKQALMAAGCERRAKELNITDKEFQREMTEIMKTLNIASIEMAKLKRTTDNIITIYSNYQLENEEEEGSDEENSDSSEANNTMYRQD